MSIFTKIKTLFKGELDQAALRKTARSMLVAEFLPPAKTMIKAAILTSSFSSTDQIVIVQKVNSALDALAAKWMA